VPSTTRDHAVATSDVHGFPMSARLPAHTLEEVAQKWRALAERRCAHFLELRRSGRWRRYYGEAQFLDRLREAIRLSARWAEIAPPPVDEAAAPPPPVADGRPRTAA
jgi:uncharacterized repeat protein (TIGR03809 family)